jgi:hypothetical protein
MGSPMSFNQRTQNCGVLRLDHAGQTVTLNGWAHRVRDLGGLLFIDLRDRTGLVQLFIDPSKVDGSAIRTESCLSITGVVKEREEKTKNANMETGEIYAEAGDELDPGVIAELEAQGLPYQMMPSFTANCGKDCKVYVQNTENKNLIRGGDVIGRQRFSVSYLPQKTGQFTIHEIVIPWFNTGTQKQEQLRIPGMKIKIQASSRTEDEPNLVQSKLSEKNQARTLPNWLLIVFGLILGMLFMQGLKFISWSKLKEKIKHPPKHRQECRVLMWFWWK